MTQRLADIQQQLIGTFFEEAAEALNQVESGLLALDKPHGDAQEIINDVFRAAHSIKGGAATFGLAAIAELAHSAETVLDKLRAGQMPASGEVTALLLSSVDVLRILVQKAAVGSTGADPRAESLRQRLDEAAKVAGPATAAISDTSARPSEGHKRFRIEFRPKPEMLTTGNDAVRLLRELGRFGTLKVEADVSRVPPLSELDPTSCYLGWMLELEGKVSRAQIDDVFAWVDGEAAIAIEELPGDAPGPQQPAEAATQRADEAAPARPKFPVM